jgi:hypothetical protein
VPKINSRVVRLHSQQPDQERISPILMGASHGSVRFPDPISAQPAQLRSWENDRIKTAFNPAAQPTTETDQPRSEHVWPRKKGMGLHYIAESRSRVSMTRSIVSRPLIAWGRMTHKKTTTSQVQSLERPIIWSRNRIILANICFTGNFEYFSHVFPLENA